MLSKYYNKIPTFQECLDLVNLDIGFSHSIQSIGGKEVHSFKYNLWSKEMLSEEIFSKGGLNLRGICFIDEKIVALPFPKFFNLNENKFSEFPFSEWKVKNIFEKIDGSLISVFEDYGRYFCKSMKSIESDVSKEAQEFFDRPENLNLRLHAMDKILQGLSPIYEYVSPTCRIVLDYGEPKMTYLGCRNMKTGEIILPEKIFDGILVPVPRIFKSTEIQNYLEQKGVEGVVITLEDGTMFKMKSEEYFEIHKIISDFSIKNMLEKIMNKQTDDIVPILKKYGMEDKIKQLIELEDIFYNTGFDIQCSCYKTYVKVKDLSRKEAAEIVLQENKKYSSIIFKMLDNKDVSTLINKYAQEEVFNLFREKSPVACYGDESLS